MIIPILNRLEPILETTKHGQISVKKPNVVIIMADQLRADVITEKYTPNISRIKDKSVVFNRAYCASPLCAPARGAFFTGKYPNENGSIINPWQKKDRAHGYVNAGISNMYKMMETKWDSWHTGKQHLFTEGIPMEHDSTSKTHWVTTEETYESFLSEKGIRKPGGQRFRGKVPEMISGKHTFLRNYSIPEVGCYEAGFDDFFDGYFLKGALQAIRNRDKSKPLLLNAMYLAPHPPFEIPEPWFSMYDQVEVPENVGVWTKNQSPLQLYNLTGILGTRYNKEDWKKIWPVYLGLVKLLDDCVGEMVKALKEEGIYDESLIIITSDHGEMLGSHCLWQKMCMYEEAVRVPLIMKFPSTETFKSQQHDRLVSAVDVLPTLCDYLELNDSHEMSGMSLMPFLKGEPIKRERVFIQYDGNGARGNFQRCIINEDFKLIVDMFKDEIFLELYHIKSDQQESENLIFLDQMKETVETMICELKEHMNQTNDLLRIPEYVYEDFLKSYPIN